jgi:Zn-dependent protease with chaperone function
VTVAVLVPLAVSVLLAGSGRRLGRMLPPRTAALLLTLTALVTALATGFVLAVLGFTVAARNAELAELGHWSARTLVSVDPVPLTAGTAAGLLVTGLAAAAMTRAVRTGRELWAAGATCRRLPHTAGLVVVQDDRPDAYALPGLSGRVVVSTGMLRSLPAGERRVLLAHESAHLAHRHHLYVQLAELAAAANPLLRPAAAAVGYAVERWADEHAAAVVGDRQLAARALARAWAARRAGRAAPAPPGPGRGAALAAAGSAVTERARALLNPPPRPRRLLTTALLGLTAASVSAGLVTAHDTEHRFEQAQSAYRAAPAPPAPR